MNKILIFLNAIIILGASYLYISHHHQESQIIEKPLDKELEEKSNSPFKIAYVNSDTLWENYIFVQEMKDDLAAEKLKIERQYSYQMKQLEEEVIEFQKKAQFMTQQQGQQREAELMQKQQELLQLQESLNIKFMESEQKKNKIVYDSIVNYINSYSKQNNIHYVFGYNMSGSMFYGTDTLNITENIVEALNSRYSNIKK